MIMEETRLNVTDNSGIKKAKCIKILGGTRRKYAYVGDIVVIAVQEVLPDSQIKKGSIQRAVIVRTKKEFNRKDGSSVRFDDNACVVIDAQKEPKGTRIFGPVARELREKRFMKIVSLAPEVV
ncbi:50S ribosomal protein L14 [candidate division WOR-3 bacterium]|jgi:large subunit ribosomal protein L14|uniref:Large ribosomal subunit protein uL14 n=1 Tax=candidate division TA06 bacterium TaxID=2250710 RepID=A0A660S5A7_UNCT6|nr:50S ribosomal protein L14 [candidate division WOR-3 bacterium]RKX64868.1 MAG: 50S ribosomal protein L14 [candidate division TA06 bacterium]